MHIEDAIVVSIDDHVIEPPDTLGRHTPETSEDRAPRSAYYRRYEPAFVG